jgi:hypothetical protein
MRLLSLVIVIAPLFLAATGCATTERVATLERENERLSVELTAAQQNNENLRCQLEQYVRELTATELQKEVTRRVQAECQKNDTKQTQNSAAQAAANANRAWSEQAVAQQLMTEMEKAIQQLRTRITQLEQNPNAKPTTPATTPPGTKLHPRKGSQTLKTNAPNPSTKATNAQKKFYRVKTRRPPPQPSSDEAEVSYNME